MPRPDVILTAAALIGGTLAASAIPAQPPPRQSQAQPAQAQAPAPAGPYKAVAFTPPPVINDPSFEAFRRQLADIARRKDRAALARLVVAQGFSWEQEKGDVADKRRPGIDNLAKALELDARDGSGWEALAGYAGDPTGTRVPTGAVCGPADPVFNEKELEDLAKATQTDFGEWGYPAGPNIEVRSAPRPNASVIEKLGTFFVRVLPDNGPANANPQAPAFLRVVLPSGRTGFVPAEAIVPLGNDQLCYVKEASGWKIAGFIGGEQ
jgi:hypothetical protein